MSTDAQAAIFNITVTADFHRRSLADIGRQVGVTAEYVRLVLKSLGIKKLSSYYARWKDLTNAEFIEAGRRAGSTRTLAQQWGIHVDTLRKHMRRRGLSAYQFRRHYFQQSIPSQRRAYERHIYATRPERREQCRLNAECYRLRIVGTDYCPKCKKPHPRDEERYPKFRAKHAEYERRYQERKQQRQP